MLLCTTSICIIAVNNKASASDSPGTEDGIYVDPNIRLTKKDLPKFKQALQQIKDPQYKELTQKIIKTIENKGYADSVDIKNILIELGMADTYSFSGRIDGMDNLAGAASGLNPLKVRPLFLWGKGPVHAGWLGFELCLQWSATGWPGFNIGGNEVTFKHTGIAYCFFGVWSQGILSFTTPYKTYCEIHGSSPLIVVTPI